jgi:DNA polymerase-3 subunit gamma/tau
MSSYLVLARKYRPRTFEEVVGQDATTRILRGALEGGRIGHAYLLAGPRGTGKTTLARIMARCLNCEQGPTPTPCGTCERCRENDAGRETDLIEIDGASNRGIEDVRLLRDEVAYAPMRARYKVYIVDEVHMLTTPAFNALLKTLEEPPRHVVFLFATTELHKVPDTVVSRCQVLRLSPLSEETIAGQLAQVFGREGVEVGPGVTTELARMARGGMRDALSIADKLLALAGSRPTFEDLARLSGETGARAAERLLDCVESGDRAELFALLARTRGDEAELLSECLALLRASAIAVHCGEEAPFLTGSTEERAGAAERGRRLGPERLEAWMQQCLRARERMRLLPGQESLVLELALLDLARPESTLPLDELLQRLEALERRLGGEGTASAGAGVSAAEKPATRATNETPTRPVSVAPAAPQEARAQAARPSERPRESNRERGRNDPGLVALWAPFLSELARNHGALSTILDRRAGPGALAPEGTGVIALELTGLDATELKLVQDRRNQAAASRALSRVAGRAVEVRFHGAGVAGADAPPNRPEGRPEGASPSSRPAKDPLAEQAAGLFGGVIEEVP